jgi:hypothetical protein
VGVVSTLDIVRWVVNSGLVAPKAPPARPVMEA